MRKIITEWKFDKLFDACEQGLGTKDEDGNLIMTPEENKEWFRRIEELEEYTALGPRVLVNKIKDKIHDYKLRHLSLGKVKYKGKNFDEGEFEITKIPFNLTWQTDTYLLVIIRDYLRNFINTSPAIGNCIYDKENEKLNDISQYHSQDVTTEYIDKAFEKWEKLVNGVADEFDTLYKMSKTEDYGKPLWKELKAKAFEDLAFIFDDLGW